MTPAADGARPTSRWSPAPPAGSGRTSCAPSPAERERVRCLVHDADERAAARGRRPDGRGRRRRRARPGRARPALRRRRRRDRLPRRRRSSTRAARPRALRRERRRHAARRSTGPGAPARPASCTCRRTRRSAPTRPRRPVHRGRRRTTRTWPTGGRSSRPSSSCSASHERGDLATVIVRPPWFYGPFQPARQTQFFARGPPGPVPARRRRHAATLDGVHRQPRRRRCCAPRSRPRRPGRAYWIADAEPYELREVLATVAQRARGRGPARVDAAPAARCRASPAWSPSSSTGCCRTGAATCRRCTCSAS